MLLHVRLFLCFSFELAQQLSVEQHYENAVLLLSKAIALWPDDDKFYAARAECFINLCDIQSAILNYRKACLLKPDVHNRRLAFLYYFNAQCLLEQSMHVEALENFSQAAELSPDVSGYRIRR
jgi:tetratricopeptide (TPR) repeat protein